MGARDGPRGVLGPAEDRTEQALKIPHELRSREVERDRAGQEDHRGVHLRTLGDVSLLPSLPFPLRGGLFRFLLGFVRHVVPCGKWMSWGQRFQHEQNVFLESREHPLEHIQEEEE